MQLALHSLEQISQLEHSSCLIFILNKENLEMYPSNVPTGQIVLQYNLPIFHDMKTTTTKAVTVIMNG